MKKTVILPAIIFLFSSCGGGSTSFTPIKKPVSIALSTEDTIFQNQKTNFAYVADQFTQSIIVLDTRSEKIVDTADDDDFDFSPIPVGGEPSAVVVDNGVVPHRIYVSDQFNNQILAYQIAATIPSSIVSYKPVSLGSILEGKSSRYLFKNSGAASSPTMTNFVVDPIVAKNESWRLKSKGNGEYEVEGTVSGLQNHNAREGKKFTSDNGGVKFFISAGSEKTTDGDEFFFSTFVTKPLQLASSPVDMLIHGRKLYILTKSIVPSIVVFDLDALSITSTTPLPDPAAAPSHMFYHDGLIYVSNLASGDIFSFDTTAPGFTTISTSLSGIAFVGATDSHLFLVQDATAKLSISNLSGSISKTLNLNDFGNSFFMTAVDGKTLGFVPNKSGNVDVVDLAALKRVDTDINDKSDFINPEFFDVLPLSKPQLISVNGTSGVTMNETWQMIFDSVTDSYLVTGSKSGIQTNRVIPGDPYVSDHGEISLLTRPSFGFPETEGDFFSFQTLDSIDPILISNQSLAIGGIGFNRISDGKPVGYILQQTNGQVSIIDLTDYNVKKTL